MKFVIVVVSLIYLGLYGQDRKSPPKPLPIPPQEVNHTFLKACADGERVFEKVRNKKADKSELIDLVLKLDYSMITELERRNSDEVKALNPARTCTKALLARVIFYLKKENQKPEKVWQ